MKKKLTLTFYDIGTGHETTFDVKVPEKFSLTTQVEVIMRDNYGLTRGYRIVDDWKKEIADKPKGYFEDDQ